MISQGSGKSVGMLVRLASVSLVLVEMSAFGQGALDDWADRMQRSRPEVASTSREWAKKSAKMLSTANVDAFAEDRAIAESSLPFPLPDDARWSRLETPEAEYLSECTFSSPDGFACRFAVYGQYGCKRAYYWTGVRTGTSADGASLTYDQGTNFVATVLSRKEMPVDVRGVRDVLVSAETEISVRGAVVDCPFDRFRFVLADDRPGANWAHPCRFVFIAEDGCSFAVSYESWKPKIRRKADGTRLWLLPGFHTARQLDLDEVKNSVYSSVPNGTGPDAAFYAGDVSHSYFVLISGGATAEDNGIRFWADTAFMYSTLTKKYGVAADHIHVLMSDGLNPAADACLGETSAGEPVLVSSPTDLDGDGTVDVDRTASWKNLCAVFNGLKSSLTTQDQLFVFVTSHGNSRGTAGESNYDCRASLYSPTGDVYDEDSNYANFTDENLHNLTKDIKCPIAFAFETCYSGGFIDDLTVTANRMVATACNHYEVSFGTYTTLAGPWTGTGIGKTKSHNSWARPFTSALRGYQPLNATTSTYPWSDGTDCADVADANGDGMVCFSEAVAYAYANDAKVCTRTTHSSTLCKGYEHPQYGESTSGLGASFWLLKQVTKPVIRPVNDNFVNATAISGASGSLTSSSANATKETGEPWHGISSATNSVWWKWTASKAGSMTITTEGSGFDTGLGVYTGSSVANLYKIDDNDDVVSGTTWSSVTFSAVAGTTYYIAVAGYKGATGSVKLNWSLSTTLPDLSFRYKNAGWPQSPFLSDSPANSNAVVRFVQGSPIYLFCRFNNEGKADVSVGFDVLHEVLDANGNCVATSLLEMNPLSAGYGRYWEGSKFTILQGLEPGDYTYRCTLDSRKMVNESNEDNNVITYAFTVISSSTVIIGRSGEADVEIPKDWFTTGKIDGRVCFNPSTFAALFGTDYAAAAVKPTGKVDAHGNPMYVWQDFVAGTDPTNKKSEFKSSINFVNGKPVISWTPDLNEGGAKSLRVYRTFGINDLSQSANPAVWREVTPGNESAYRFFRVEVDLQ